MDYKLVVVSGDLKKRVIPIKPPTVIGRSKDADITLGHSLISRKHCEITIGDDELLIVEDLGSTNGTFHGDEKITEPVYLEPGDLLRVGAFTFKAVYGNADEAVTDAQGEGSSSLFPDFVEEEEKPQPKGKGPAKEKAPAAPAPAKGKAAPAPPAKKVEEEDDVDYFEEEEAAEEPADDVEDFEEAEEEEAAPAAQKGPAKAAPRNDDETVFNWINEEESEEGEAADEEESPPPGKGKAKQAGDSGLDSFFKNL